MNLEKGCSGRGFLKASSLAPAGPPATFDLLRVRTHWKANAKDAGNLRGTFGVHVVQVTVARN